MRQVSTEFEMNVTYDVLLYKNMVGTEEWKLEVEDIYTDGFGSQWFILYEFESAKELASTLLINNEEFVCADISINVFDGEGISESYVIWGGVVVDNNVNFEDKDFFEHVNIDNSKN